MPRGVKRAAEDDAGATSTRPKKTAKMSHEKSAPKAKAEATAKETKGKKVRPLSHGPDTYLHVLIMTPTLTEGTYYFRVQREGSPAARPPNAQSPANRQTCCCHSGARLYWASRTCSHQLLYGKLWMERVQEDFGRT